MRAAAEVLVLGIASVWLLGLVPAMVVAVMKGRLLFFAAGWLFLGVTWFIGALSLAEPDSWWARRFYGDSRMARAEEPLRHRRPARVTALWLGGALATVLVVGLFAARPTPITGVDGEALQFSVGGSLTSPGEGCAHLGTGEWRCDAQGGQDSSPAPYRVRVHGLGCWTATPELPGGERRRGCITIVDEIFG